MLAMLVVEHFLRKEESLMCIHTKPCAGLRLFAHNSHYALKEKLLCDTRYARIQVEIWRDPSQESSQTEIISSLYGGHGNSLSLYVT